ncbi:hypothetical protein K470DRAFT_117288 [Piedraia hortae CBS 480.64]|uniref:Uncharacterized protein n=1 Tax=Piedraia hortae CBS 480.64 TaxID=1314780 RepID=A0A6A7BU20_9PEZI|nr:hypothetical protein K470DRAFT_117288 [Piedraia hortae CBS 480.64]
MQSGVMPISTVCSWLVWRFIRTSSSPGRQETSVMEFKPVQFHDDAHRFHGRNVDGRDLAHSRAQGAPQTSMAMDHILASGSCPDSVPKNTY